MFDANGQDCAPPASTGMCYQKLEKIQLEAVGQ